MHQFIPLLSLIAPVAFLTVAWMAYLKRSDQNFLSKSTLQGLAGVGIFVSLVSLGMVLANGTLQSSLLGWRELGFSMRLDALSSIMFAMISILGFIILRFSSNYLDGDERKTVFLIRLLTTMASVELLVLSGNLGQLFFFWVLTSFCMHYLLVFYRNRPQAVAAARKKFIVARIGDVSLFISLLLMYNYFGTGDLSTIFLEVKNLEGLDTSLTAATVFLVLAAVLKSAQFPTHGWLIEVVETPTPVSALLHAGILNAGPFLILRMSLLIDHSSTAALMLLIIGGFTAMFASVVFLTQPTVKIALGYSSVAHMGFSLMVCGLGVYSAALLHLVAHSFYKAHSFLSSGSAVDLLRAKNMSVPERKGSILRIVLSVGFSVGVYLVLCKVWGIELDKDFGLMAIGSIIVLGMSQILVQTFDSKSTFIALIRSIGLVFLVAGSFFVLEQAAHDLLQAEIPAESFMSATAKIITLVLLAFFFTIVLLQMLSPKLKSTAIGYKLGVHLRNGLYVNVVFDRMVGSLKSDKFKWANLTVQEEEEDTLSSEIETIQSKL